MLLTQSVETPEDGQLPEPLQITDSTPTVSRSNISNRSNSRLESAPTPSITRHGYTRIHAASDLPVAPAAESSLSATGGQDLDGIPRSRRSSVRCDGYPATGLLLGTQ